MRALKNARRAPFLLAGVIALGGCAIAPSELCEPAVRLVCEEATNLPVVRHALVVADRVNEQVIEAVAEPEPDALQTLSLIHI